MIFIFILNTLFMSFGNLWFFVLRVLLFCVSYFVSPKIKSVVFCDILCVFCFFAACASAYSILSLSDTVFLAVCGFVASLFGRKGIKYSLSISVFFLVLCVIISCFSGGNGLFYRENGMTEILFSVYAVTSGIILSTFNKTKSIYFIVSVMTGFLVGLVPLHGFSGGIVKIISSFYAVLLSMGYFSKFNTEDLYERKAKKRN